MSACTCEARIMYRQGPDSPRLCPGASCKARFRTGESWLVGGLYESVLPCCRQTYGAMLLVTLWAGDMLRGRERGAQDQSLGLRSRQQFKVGEGEDEHAVTIKIDFAPNVITLLIHPENWIARAYVDGVLAVEDLTPRPRSTVRVISRISNYGLLIALGILAVTILCIVVQYFRLR